MRDMRLFRYRKHSALINVDKITKIVFETEVFVNSDMTPKEYMHFRVYEGTAIIFDVITDSEVSASRAECLYSVIADMIKSDSDDFIIDIREVVKESL